MRILVFAYHEIGYLCLEHLLKSGENVVGLFTYKPNKKENIWFKTPDTIAKKYNVPVYYDEDLSSVKIKKLIVEKLKPDLIFSFYFREKIPSYILQYPKLGAFNLHGAYLPYYRGCAPLNWVLVNGEKFTGITFHYMADKFDTGNIVARCKFRIAKQDDINSLYKKFHKYGLALFKKIFPKIKSGKIKSIKQDLSAGSYFGKRKPEDGLINWSKMDAEQVYNLIRAVTYPYPGAYTYFDGKKFILWKAKIINANQWDLNAGEAIVRNGIMYVGCKDHKLLKVTNFECIM